MNIKQAKNEIKHTVQAYLAKNETGAYKIPAIRQRPILLMGPPGIGKTQIMEQIARQCSLGLVAYTITHHTRQSAVGLPRIEKMLGYTNLESEKGFTFFQNFLKDTGILEELEALGIQEGDTVRMYGLSFDYYK